MTPAQAEQLARELTEEHNARRQRTLDTADHALLEMLVVYLRQHGEARAREVLQMALLELERQRS